MVLRLIHMVGAGDSPEEVASIMAFPMDLVPKKIVMALILSCCRVSKCLLPFATLSFSNLEMSLIHGGRGNEQTAGFIFDPADY
jgi:hypothetical protein